MLALVSLTLALSNPRYSVESLVHLVAEKACAAYGVNSDGSIVVGMARDINNDETAVMWKNNNVFVVQKGYTARKITDNGEMLLLDQTRTKVAYYSDSAGLVPLETGHDIYADMNMAGSIVVGGYRADNSRFDFKWSASGGRVNLSNSGFRARCVSGNGTVGGSINWISTLQFPSGNILFIYMYGTTGSRVVSMSENGHLTFTASFPGGVNKAYTYTSFGGAESFGMFFTHVYRWQSPPMLSPVQINDKGTIIGDYGSDTESIPFIKFDNSPALEINPRLVPDSRGWQIKYLRGENNELLVGEATSDNGLNTAVVLHPVY